MGVGHEGDVWYCNSIGVTMATTPITFEIPVKAVSLTNEHTHWRKKANTAKAQRKAGYLYAMQARIRTLPFPLVITMTRIAPRPLDSDNLPPSMKSIRDGISDALKIDDRDPRVEWEYKQSRRKPKEYAVIVEAVTLAGAQR